MKKTYFILSFLLLSFSQLFSQNYQCDKYTEKKVLEKKDCDVLSDYILVFEDNFDGNSLDLTKWLYRCPWSNKTNADYVTQGDNMEFNNGILSIIAKNNGDFRRLYDDYTISDDSILDDGLPNLRWFKYTSGLIFSRQKFLTGKFEIRCKIPELMTTGAYPAFWLFGECQEEIDIFEFWRHSRKDKHANKNLRTNHLKSIDCIEDANRCEKKITADIDYTLDFHTFTMEWTDYSLSWIVDGVILRTVYKYRTVLSNTPVYDCNSIKDGKKYNLNQLFPTRPLTLIANLAVNGKLDEDLVWNFPYSMEIDYIRVWEKSNCTRDVSDCDFIDNELPSYVSGRNITLGECFKSNPTNKNVLHLTATEEINLEDGFETYADYYAVEFEAEIVPCSEKSLSEKTKTIETVSELKTSNLEIHPNPFTNSVTINYMVSETALTSIKIYNLYGQLQTTVLNEYKTQGEYVLEYNLSQLPAGLYICIMQNGNNSVVTKIVKS